MNWKHSMKVLQELCVGEYLKHQRTETSSVTTAWGVEWDESFIARDIMQNFFDANRGSLSEVRVEETEGTVRFWAPGAFNLERLFFLGSEKSGDDIGRYGEGFKVAPTCLLRDHNVTPLAWSGNQVLAMRIAEKIQRELLDPGTNGYYDVDNAMESIALL